MRHTGLEASTSTHLCPSDQAGEALGTSSEPTSSSMLEIFVTSTMVSSRILFNPKLLRPVLSSVCLRWRVCLFLRRRRTSGAFEETGRKHPLVVRAGHCSTFGEHCQAGAELLHSHGSPEWRQVVLLAHRVSANETANSTF